MDNKPLDRLLQYNCFSTCLYHNICLYYTVINSLAYNVVESTRSQNIARRPELPFLTAGLPNFEPDGLAHIKSTHQSMLHTLMKL
jgi:hypothetical protein